MARVTLPSDVTPQQLDAMFRKLLKLSPKDERAVRLRLEGKTYKEIVLVLNTERQPDAKHVGEVWVCRRCQSAEKKLSKTASEHMDRDEGPNTTIYGTAKKIASALHSGQQPFNRAGLPPKPEGKRKKLYMCHGCFSTELQSQPTINDKRNSREHVCLKCGRIHTTAERNTKWCYVPLSFQPQERYCPFPDEYDKDDDVDDGEK